MRVDLLREVVEIDFLGVLTKPHTAELVFRFVTLPAPDGLQVNPLPERRRFGRRRPVPVAWFLDPGQRLHVRVEVGNALVRKLHLGVRQHDAPRLANGVLELFERETASGQVGTESTFPVLAVTEVTELAPPQAGAGFGITRLSRRIRRQQQERKQKKYK